MRGVVLRLRVVIPLLAFACIASTEAANAHISVNCNPSQNKIKLEWGFPCADHPENGKDEAGTDGSPQNPPANVCMGPFFYSQQSPPDFDSNVIGDACCTDGQPQFSLFVHGCAHAGGKAIEGLSGQTASAETYAALGLPRSDGVIPPDSTLSFHVERVVIPGPTPDVLNITLQGGGMQTRVTPGDHASAVLDLIVYPDAATAAADSNALAGVGSSFFGRVTLLGESGSLLPERDFSAADFLLQDNGGGTYTVRPVGLLTKSVLVPDANQAVVTMVGDPTTTPQGTTGVPGPSLASGLWLDRATPNPAPGETHIRFGIPGAAHVSLAIYDQQGRRVRELVNGRLPAGEHQMTWDGLDATGRRVPSTLYFYRLVVDGTRLTGKVFMIH